MKRAQPLSLTALSRFVPLAALVCLSHVPGNVRADDAPRPSRRGVEFFESKIRPVLVKHCYECHAEGADEIGGGLWLDTRAGTRQGGDSGAAVVPKDLAQSLLLDAIEYKSFEMPPDGKLPDAVIADFRRWIRMGAPDPRGEESGAPEETATSDEKPSLWSLSPVTNPEPPSVNDEQWPRSDVDRFVRAAQESRSLQPVGDADPLTLLRRVCIDLTGLPPSLEQIAQFESDPSPEAFTALVDELLGSPQFGERWARFWLDVVRYGESAGSSRDVLMIHAWRYRDYVIDALNADVPFDQFVTEQIAGDLLTPETDEEAQRMRVATGLLALGSKVAQRRQPATRRHRRSDRRHRQSRAGADRQLRPVPRPQVRSDSDRRLLRAGRDLSEYRDLLRRQYAATKDDRRSLEGLPAVERTGP